MLRSNDKNPDCRFFLGYLSLAAQKISNPPAGAETGFNKLSR